MQKDYKKQKIYNNKSDSKLQPYPIKKNTLPNTPIKTYTPSPHPSYAKTINATPTSSGIGTGTLNTKPSTPSIQIGELLYSKDDSYEDLVSKNIKLRTLVIQASNTISELSKKCRNIESNCNEEKEAILVELDKISQKYQLYADSHKQISKIKSDFQQLTIQYNQNNKVMEAYQQSIVSLLKDNMKTFVSISNMINSGAKIFVTPQEFLCEIRQFLWENLNKYHSIIDSVVFGTFYEEYMNFITMVNKEEEEYNEMNNTIKKKRPNIRKKEYVDSSTNSNNNNTNTRSNQHPQPESKISSQSYRYNRYTQHKHNKSYDINNKNQENINFE